MNIKFKTFNPYTDYDTRHGKYQISATSALNSWLEENPKVEVIDWKTTAVGTTNEIYITIQYRESEDA
jgi:hypothetical protein